MVKTIEQLEQNACKYWPQEILESVEKFKEVNMWAISNTQYTQSAKDKFTDADRADIYLVTYASLNPYEWTVVSQEKSLP